MSSRSTSYTPIMETASSSKEDAFVTSKSPPSAHPLVRKRPMIALVVVLGILTVVIVTLQFYVKTTSSGKEQGIKDSAGPCSGDCTVTLVESIPQNVKFPAGSTTNPSIYSGWKYLLQIAKEEINIASFYWTLRGSDTNTTDASTQEGEDVFASLKAAAKRGIKIRIVQIPPSEAFPSLDTLDLQTEGLAEVRSLNMTRLTGGGILHTKMWLVDGKHFYLGSANLDWRALTQIQELGFMTYNCSCLGSDMSKIFEVYWDLAKKDSKIPDPWPKKYKTAINSDTPAQIRINGSQSAGIFLSSSPKLLCPPGRADDLETILQVINGAKKFVYVSVMDYFPTTLYTPERTYWPVIDDALRKAAFDRKVQVRLMASLWNHTRPDLKFYLRSLAALNTANFASIEVRLYQVPPIAVEIPYARVNHNKFMVTEKVAYVGTSNWSADYFSNTGGVGYVVNETETGDSLRARLQAVFERNWNSSFTIPINCGS